MSSQSREVEEFIHSTGKPPPGHGRQTAEHLSLTSRSAHLLGTSKARTKSSIVRSV